MNAVKVLFASGSDATIAQALEKFKGLFPELPLVVVSEFAPPATENGGEWIPYHIRRRWLENRALIRSRLRGREIRLAAVILEPGTPHRRMRLLGMSLAPRRLLAFNETGQHFRLSPTNLPVMSRHLLWRAGNLVRVMRRRQKLDWRLLFWYVVAQTIGFCRLRKGRPPRPIPCPALPPGVSVVIPSRNGRELLATCLPLIDGADEIIVIDNGSDDGTRTFLRDAYPSVVLEHSDEPLSFAEAANRGIARTRYSHVCLLNNDMLVEPGFIPALRACFDRVPRLFSSSAQIFFPEGQRREETGKTVLDPTRAPTDFPVRCIDPLTGEDGTWVLYGSGGCTLYDTAKLRALGGFDPAYETAYVEDLDAGVRAWRHGWPSVYCAAARVLHKHRATTSRYFTPEQLDRILERNFLRFVSRELPSLWCANLRRLRAAMNIDALKFAAKLLVSRRQADGFLSLVKGDVAVFPGKPDSGKPRVLIVSPYLPFPLSHGAAVRMYNLMRRAAAYADQVLVCFAEDLAAAPRELTEMCCEIVMVRRSGTHALQSTLRPDTVEEFDSPAFHEALKQTAAKWQPQIGQLEFTQMALYAADCQPARTILVEHDITYDLYAQMLAREEDWETRRQYERWLRFETDAWRRVDRVITMSEKDRSLVLGAVSIPNGVDLERFHPSDRTPEPRRVLFIGSFAHRPNVLAVEYFLREVFPLLHDVTLHVIAGQRHEQFWDLRHPGVEVEGFVADVRPAYERAAVVVAPLVVSAGTNIKIMEAMAMGKAIASTTAGVHGLDLRSGADLVVTDAPKELARAISLLLDSPEQRQALEQQARSTAEQRFGWNAISRAQQELYESLLTSTQNPPCA
ncbi:MAG TPA: glycosyltransferase [Bryobacteraceae bacterium]|nr:glycosyltransferase [Bryobacteraceae bacterium]